MGSSMCLVTSSTISLASDAVTGLQSAGNSLMATPVRRASSNSFAAVATLLGFIVRFPLKLVTDPVRSAIWRNLVELDGGTSQRSVPNRVRHLACGRGRGRAG